MQNQEILMKRLQAFQRVEQSAKSALLNAETHSQVQKDLMFLAEELDLRPREADLNTELKQKIAGKKKADLKEANEHIEAEQRA